MKKLSLFSVLAVALLLLAAIVFHRSHNHVEATHHTGPQAATDDEPGLQRAECLEWVAETYRVATLVCELDLDLARDVVELRACMAENVRHMAVPIPVPWCDNIFKIHCSGLDLFVEIGEGLADRCESHLAGALVPEREDFRERRACVRNAVYERYSLRGEASDHNDCRTLFDECGPGTE
jgi:hypothetical protein